MGHFTASAPTVSRKQRQAAEKGSLFTVALRMHQAGRLTEAEALYRKAIAANPRDGVSMTNLGLIAYQAGRLDEAMRCFLQACRAMPDYTDAHVNLGAVYRDLGRLDDAEASLRRALTLQPAHALAQINLGRVLRARQRHGEAIELFRAALAAEPGALQAEYHLAATLIEHGQPEAAVPILTEILRQNPDLPEVCCELGLAYEHFGQLDEASTHYSRVLRLQPAFWVARFNLGGIFQQQGRLHEAAECCRETLRLQPNLLLAHLRLGQVLFDLGQLQEAVSSFTRALQLRPEDPDALHGMGNVLQRVGDHANAVEAYKRAITARPGAALSWLNLGQALQAAVRLDEAIVAFTQAVRLDPGLRIGWLYLASAKMYAADWAESDLCERQVLDAIPFNLSRASPFIYLMVNSTPAQQLATARQWVASTVARVETLPSQPPRAGDRIRIGYLSTDFREHATAFLMTGLIESHDRSRFETIAYSIGSDDGSDTRRRLETAFDRFVDLNALSHEQAARRIHADRVDILVDLKGHTAGSRTEILAYRPAPIQVNYLGYPSTMGADFVDYIMVDPVIVPPAMAPFFSEKLVHLPYSYQPNMRRPIAQAEDNRVDHGLPDVGFVFCCFNQAYKITPPVFDLWMGLLRSVPGSVLWLLDWNPLATANLRRHAAELGIDPSRLIFGPLLRSAEHLARLRHADLCLDTLPVCAHTTASDALWAGVPMLSCLGETFVSRVSSSLLMAMGLDSLVTETLPEYEALALRITRDRSLLASLRRRVDDARLTSPLFDTALATRHLEAAFSAMWQRHEAGMPPDAFAVPPLA